MHKRLVVGAALGSFALGGWVAACGIDETGLASGDAATNDVTLSDVVGQDGGADVNGFDVSPLTCEEAGTSIDASCLGVPVPAGWTPVAYRENAKGCNNAPNFQALDGITDASVPSGQCFCSDCKVVGGWTCTATLGNMGSCTSQTQTFTTSGCYNQGAFHFGGTLARSGDAGCAPGNPVDASIAATPASVCVPTACEADFCGLVAQGFQGCIQNTTTPDAGCPGGFTNMKQAAPSATASCTCSQCANTNTTAGCTGTVTAMSGQACGGNVVDQTRALDSCTNTSGYQSVYYDAGPVPQPTCQPTAPATGTATLASPLTICCK